MPVSIGGRQAGHDPFRRVHWLPRMRRCLPGEKRRRSSTCRKEHASLCGLSPAAIAVIFVGGVAAAKLTSHWDTRVPDYVLYQLVPAANEQTHP